MKLRAPSKTFFIGEYAVLAGYPALVATTPPFFTLDISDAYESELVNIHLESPAGQLWLQQSRQPARLEFIDPHQGLGGYGASSAQFLLMYQWIHGITHWDHAALQALLASYHQFSRGKGSGADLLSQAVGGFVIVNPQKCEVESTPWPFPQLNWQLQHTGQKCVTHQHLASLENHDFSPLGKLSEAAIKAYRAQDAEQFVQCINHYHDTLHSMNLVHESTQQLINDFRQLSTLAASKGCGALGADVILTLSEVTDEVVC